MMMRVLPFLAVLNACEQPDETVTAYSDHDGVFRLSTLNGEVFTSVATIDLRVAGTISGTAPCNTYRTTQTAPYPWITLGPIASTKRACPQLETEARFLAALATMTIIETSDDLLILSNEEGGRMVFYASP